MEEIKLTKKEQEILYELVVMEIANNLYFNGFISETKALKTLQGLKEKLKI